MWGHRMAYLNSNETVWEFQLLLLIFLLDEDASSLAPDGADPKAVQDHELANGAADALVAEDATSYEAGLDSVGLDSLIGSDGSDRFGLILFLWNLVCCMSDVNIDMWVSRKMFPWREDWTDK